MYPKPLLKWVGGKTQILDKISNKIPKSINNYYEMFLGGGSVLFAILQLKKNGLIQIEGKLCAFDLNRSLITFYNTIQKHHHSFYNEIVKLITEYQSLENECEEINRNPTTLTEAKMCKENYYYWIRKKFNDLKKSNGDFEDEVVNINLSVLFLFLNKTCFRGLYREGPNGYNVPFGHYKNPEIINKEHLEEIHVLIQEVEFKCCDFEFSMLCDFEQNDFVYLDPPYAPENASSFVKYTGEGFQLEKHQTLFTYCHCFSEQNVKFLMHNADVDLVVKSFSKHEFNIDTISCKRTINSKNPESKTNEVMIMNY